MGKYFKIGEISRMYHIGTDSLRYYEKLGILKPKRGENQYRLYRTEDIWRLNVIRELRELGFSLEKRLSRNELASSGEALPLYPGRIPAG